MTNYEYLIFNFLVFIGPVLVMLCRRDCLKLRPKSLFFVYACVSMPFIVWDALVADRWWYFNHSYVTGPKIGPLPVEEILFFFTVPFATLFLWVNIGPKLTSSHWLNLKLDKYIAIFPALSLLLSLVGLWLSLSGRHYSGAVFFLPLLVLTIDRTLNTRLAEQKTFWQFQLVTVGLNLLTNTYLTARPVIHYHPPTMLNIRVGTIPLEDFFFGFGLIALSQIIYHKSASTPA